MRVLTSLKMGDQGSPTISVMLSLVQGIATAAIDQVEGGNGASAFKSGRITADNAEAG